MRCYFYAKSHNPGANEVGPGIIAFCIPDLGFSYRAAIRATPSEFPYRAALGLLRFLESNRKVWGKQKLELLTDCTQVVYQINGQMPAPRRVLNELGTIRIRKRRLGFTVGWVSSEENRARENVALQPIAKPAPELNFESLQDTTLVRRAASWKKPQPGQEQPKA